MVGGSVPAELCCESRLVEELPHLDDESVLDAEEEGMLYGDRSASGFSITPGPEVSSVQRCSHGDGRLVSSDRVDGKPEVGERGMPLSNDAFEVEGVGGAGGGSDVQWEFAGEQPGHPREVLFVPTFLE